MRTGCLALSLLLFGCGSAVGAGVEAYEQARYPDAARSFAQVRAAELDRDERARYQLYTGLNHLALGNLELAVAQLTSARRALERDPRVLCPEDQARLFAAWRALGRPLGRALVE